MSKGKLFLVPAPLDFGCDTQAPLTDVMPLATLQIAARLSCWICENAKSTRAYLKRINELQPLSTAVQALQIQELPREVHKKGDHAGNFDARPLLTAAIDGSDIGLVSEAGMPAIADPGSSVVRAAYPAISASYSVCLRFQRAMTSSRASSMARSRGRRPSTPAVMPPAGSPKAATGRAMAA